MDGMKVKNRSKTMSERSINPLKIERYGEGERSEPRQRARLEGSGRSRSPYCTNVACPDLASEVADERIAFVARHPGNTQAFAFELIEQCHGGHRELGLCQRRIVDPLVTADVVLLRHHASVNARQVPGLHVRGQRVLAVILNLERDRRDLGAHHVLEQLAGHRLRELL